MKGAIFWAESGGASQSCIKYSTSKYQYKYQYWVNCQQWSRAP